MSAYIKRPPKVVRAKVQPRPAPAARPRRTAPSAPTARMAQPSPLMSERAQQQLVAEAVEYFHTAVSSDAVDAAAKRAAHYASDAVWSELTKDWRGRNCRWLARLARYTLQGKDWIHGLVGKLAVRIMELFGMPPIVRLFGEEVAKRLPLPWDHQLVAVARGMQVAGVLICIINGRDLMKCECFRDVVIDEGKERLKQLMQKATQDWRNLGDLALS